MEKAVVRPEIILKVTKEIVVKFMETGKVSSASFDETFKNVYRAVQDAVSDTDGEAKGE